MTIQEWFNYAKTNQTKLESFVSNYHPGMQTYMPKKMHITAPNAERACQSIRAKIKQETKSNPLNTLSSAIQEQNVEKVYIILNSAWFGVPESGDCWNIEGFREAVTLLEDVPEDENDSQK